MNGTRTGLTEMVHALADVESENTVILCVPYTMLGLESGRVALGVDIYQQAVLSQRADRRRYRLCL